MAESETVCPGRQRVPITIAFHSQRLTRRLSEILEGELKGAGQDTCALGPSCRG